MQTTMVEWENSSGQVWHTRVATAQLRPFLKDVNTANGRLREMHDEDGE